MSGAMLGSNFKAWVKLPYLFILGQTSSNGSYTSLYFYDEKDFWFFYTITYLMTMRTLLNDWLQKSHAWLYLIHLFITYFALNCVCQVLFI